MDKVKKRRDIMNKEFSYGAIVFRREGYVTKYLMVYSERNKIWEFPKGHVENGETEREAALREVREETGISNLKFIDGFREEDVYTAESNRGPYKGQDIEKHSIYYLCETQAVNIVVDAGEITDYKWVARHEALPLLAFDSLKQLLNKAEAYSHMEFPKDAKWKKIAIDRRLDRYVLDPSKYKLPYYEVKWIDLAGDDHEVHFVIPGDYIGLWKGSKETIDVCNKYAAGPYYDHLKAIRADSRKRGLPSEIEE
jgi:bis(5'-nucleosidyl)-tetraphosphatase